MPCVHGSSAFDTLKTPSMPLSAFMRNDLPWRAAPKTLTRCSGWSPSDDRNFVAFGLTWRSSFFMESQEVLIVISCVVCYVVGVSVRGLGVGVARRRREQRSPTKVNEVWLAMVQSESKTMNTP